MIPEDFVLDFVGDWLVSPTMVQEVGAKMFGFTATDIRSTVWKLISDGVLELDDDWWLRRRRLQDD